MKRANFSIKQIVSHVLPLAIVSFCLITLRVSHHCPGDPEEFNYGFPFGWLTPSLVSSMEYIVDLRALAIDFVVYVSVWFLLSLTNPLRRLFSWHPLLVSVGLWVLALAIGGLPVFALTHTGHRGAGGICAATWLRGDGHLPVAFWGTGIATTVIKVRRRN